MNTTNTSGIHHFLIAGSGLEAWLTASFLLKHLGQRNRITVCPVAGSDELDCLYTVFPSSGDILNSLGISNVRLVKACRTSFSLGGRYTGLSASAADFDQFRPYGQIGIDFLGGAFIHHWLREQQSAGKTLSASDYFSFSPAYQAGSKGTFAPPVKRNAIGSLQHDMARHVDFSLLGEQLRAQLVAAGVVVLEGEFKSAGRSAENMLTQLTTTAGETVQADLYIDCSGRERCLAGDSSLADYVPVPLSPAYQMEVRTENADTQPPPYSRISALGTGWQVTNPGYGWNLTLDLLECGAEDDAAAFQAGYVRSPWVGNCLALGVAAAKILPIEALQTKTLVTSLTRLVQLLPGADCADAETSEFNNLHAQDMEEVADVSTLFELARQMDGLSATNIADNKVPESLRNKISLFSKRGWVAPIDSHLLSRSDWTAVFILLGLFPGQYDRIVERIPASELDQHLKDLKTRIEKVAAEFPPHGMYLNAMKSTPENRA